ncbi:SPOR domain-containing protein, partial [Leptolyngbya cf. ectocarpi LEGE 11479]
ATPPATPPTAASPTTAPETTAANPAPAAPAPTATTGSNFYIVTNYTGDASLNKARTLVPDAFVRNFKTGARIQLAAFDNRAQAEDQVAFLTQQGATVELVGPTNE